MLLASGEEGTMLFDLPRNEKNGDLLPDFLSP